MASKAETELWAKLDVAEKRKAELLAQVAPLEADKERACAERNRWNAEAERLANQINEAIFPEMRELTSEIALTRKALHGKERPIKPGDIVVADVVFTASGGG